MCNNTRISNISRCVVAQFRLEVKRHVSTRKNFCDRLKHVDGCLKTGQKYVNHFTFSINYLSNSYLYL